DRPLRPGRRSSAGGRRQHARRPAAVGLPLHICPGDAARHRRGRNLGHGAMNAAGFSILSLLLAVPMVGAIGCLVSGAAASRWIALIATLVSLALGLVLWNQFEIGGAQWQFQE